MCGVIRKSSEQSNLTDVLMCIPMDNRRAEHASNGHVGELMRAWRRETRMTQAELAEASGVKRSHIAKIESGGMQSVRSDTVERIAHGLHITASQFWRGPRIERATISDGEADELAAMIARLDPDERQIVAQFIRLVLRRPHGELPVEDIGRGERRDEKRDDAAHEFDIEKNRWR